MDLLVRHGAIIASKDQEQGDKWSKLAFGLNKRDIGSDPVLGGEFSIHEYDIVLEKMKRLAS